MNISYFNILEEKVLQGNNPNYEPTLNIFKNGIVINHQKVGTRFLQKVVSGNEYLSNTDNKQFQFQIVSNPQHGNNILKPIDYHLTKRYVCSPWLDEGRPHLVEGYNKEYNDEIFLKEQGNYENYTDFFFNNKKDFIFLIRNPIHRFFSGVIQILEVNQDNMTLKEFGNTLRENFETILSDIHCINYLHNVVEMIYNINDKSKIKIIDLAQLKTKKSYNFFCDLREDNIIEPLYKHLESEISSNRNSYLKIYELYKEVDPDNSIFIQYIQKEYSLYKDLKKSRYFLNLSGPLYE